MGGAGKGPGRAEAGQGGGEKVGPPRRLHVLCSLRPAYGGVERTNQSEDGLLGGELPAEELGGGSTVPETLCKCSRLTCPVPWPGRCTPGSSHPVPSMDRSWHLTTLLGQTQTLPEHQGQKQSSGAPTNVKFAILLRKQKNVTYTKRKVLFL